jgi:TPP-dependent pyruvate/acetoin dehydrogenase alpha subunit
MNKSNRTEADQQDGLALTKEKALEIYELMLTSRVFDEYVNARIDAGDSAPHFHSGVGQEALSVAGASALRKDDYLIYGHRGYAHLIAKGVPLRTLMLDMMHKAGGSNDGFGGILHVAQPSSGIVGRNGAFGTNFGISAGLGISALKQKNGRVTMLYYGEAAGARGPLYEALNLAVLWKLPVVLVAENNGYSISSRTETLYPHGRMSAVWRGFDIPVEVIDGNDALAVYEACTRAVDHARRGEGPSVLEGLTYRIDPHRPVIDNHLLYRSADEIESWRKRDPLRLAEQALTSKGWLGPNTKIRSREEIWSEVEAAWLHARQAPPPGVELLEERKALL